MIVPSNPGLLPALGFLEAEFKNEFVQTFICSTVGLDPEAIWSRFRVLGDRAGAWLEEEGVATPDRTLRHTIDFHYEQQGFEVSVPVTAEVLGRGDLSAVIASFHDMHEQLYNVRLTVPITLDIIENALKNVRFEMDGVVCRTSLSPVIREQHDEFPMICWCVMMSIFHGAVLVGFSSIFGHMVNVGEGPGSMPADARSIWEEGLRIPPVRIYDRGVLNRGVLDIMLNNSRMPDMNRSNLMALLAGCRVAGGRCSVPHPSNTSRTTIRSWSSVIARSVPGLREAVT